MTATPDKYYSSCCLVLVEDEEGPDVGMLCPKCGKPCELIDENEADFQRAFGKDRF